MGGRGGDSPVTRAALASLAPSPLGADPFPPWATALPRMSCAVPRPRPQLHVTVDLFLQEQLRPERSPRPALRFAHTGPLPGDTRPHSGRGLTPAPPPPQPAYLPGERQRHWARLDTPGVSYTWPRAASGPAHCPHVAALTARPSHHGLRPPCHSGPGHFSIIFLQSCHPSVEGSSEQCPPPHLPRAPPSRAPPLPGLRKLSVGPAARTWPARPPSAAVCLCLLEKSPQAHGVG